MNPVTIQSDDGRAVARILPELGFNCFEWKYETGDETLDLLYAHPEFTAGNQRPTRSGIPLLFPFAGRIANASFHWKGKDYTLTPGDDFGNAIHGFVLNRPWKVVEHELESVTGLISSTDFESDLRDRWPSDYELRVAYRFPNSHTLETKIIAKNIGSEELPFGFGLHPYFRVPFDRRTAMSYFIRCPVTEHWQLERSIPTGKVEQLPNPADFRHGIHFDGAKFDDVFGGIAADPYAEFSVGDDRLKLVIRFDKTQYPFVVLFIPPHNEAVCIEPYTTLPNAFALQQSGTPTNLQVLAPGQQWQSTVRYDVRAEKHAR